MQRDRDKSAHLEWVGWKSFSTSSSSSSAVCCECSLKVLIKHRPAQRYRTSIISPQSIRFPANEICVEAVEVSDWVFEGEVGESFARSGAINAV